MEDRDENEDSVTYCKTNLWQVLFWGKRVRGKRGVWENGCVGKQVRWKTGAWENGCGKTGAWENLKTSFASPACPANPIWL